MINTNHMPIKDNALVCDSHKHKVAEDLLKSYNFQIGTKKDLPEVEYYYEEYDTLTKSKAVISEDDSDYKLRQKLKEGSKKVHSLQNREIQTLSLSLNESINSDCHDTLKQQYGNIDFIRAARKFNKDEAQYVGTNVETYRSLYHLCLIMNEIPVVRFKDDRRYYVFKEFVCATYDDLFRIRIQDFDSLSTITWIMLSRFIKSVNKKSYYRAMQSRDASGDNVLPILNEVLGIVPVKKIYVEKNYLDLGRNVVYADIHFKYTLKLGCVTYSHIYIKDPDGPNDGAEEFDVYMYPDQIFDSGPISLDFYQYYVVSGLRHILAKKDELCGDF